MAFLTQSIGKPSAQNLPDIDAHYGFSGSTMKLGLPKKGSLLRRPTFLLLRREFTACLLLEYRML